MGNHGANKRARTKGLGTVSHTRRSERSVVRPALSHLALLALALALLLPVTTSRAQAAPPDRPRIGLCLAGGGARGGAHVGVLQVLEEMRVPIHCVAGV